MSRGLLATSTLAFVFLSTACRNEDCLRPDPADVSPPALSMTIVFRPPTAVRDDTLTVTAADSSLQIEAVNSAGFRIWYQAQDPEGMRRLQLGATVLTTVGIGIESRRVPVEPLLAPCPVASLSSRWHAPPGDPGRSVSMGLVAENWAGLRAATQTVTVRLR